MPLLKMFACTKCGCRRFWRMVTREQMVDWTHEGAVEGHPYIEGAWNMYFPVQFRCAECGALVDETTAAEMEQEVL